MNDKNFKKDNIISLYFNSRNSIFSLSFIRENAPNSTENE